jgi:succinate semialdehyde reductase (NADPH)
VFVPAAIRHGLKTRIILRVRRATHAGAWPPAAAEEDIISQATMRAAVLDEPGTGLRVETICKPQPRAGEVLVRVRACGVCHTDLHVIKGEVAFPTPCVLGHEVSGIVEAVGAGVSTCVPGDSVIAAFLMPCGWCRWCARGRDDLCDTFFALNRVRGTLYDGTTRLHRIDGTPLAMYSMAGLAEYAVAPATAVFGVPGGVDLEAAAVLGCAVLTAYGAVAHAGAVRPGDRVAVVAVGGVGLNIVQMARAFGAVQVIAVGRSQSKLDAAKRMGATDTVDGSAIDPVVRVRELTGGDGVDVAFEALGRPQTFQQALAMVREGGTMVAVGIADGAATAAVGITHLVRRSIRLVGSYGGRARADMPTLIGLTAAGAIDVAAQITTRVPLEEAGRAYQALDRGEIVGRALVVP